MKKVVAVVILLGIIIGGVAWAVMASPERSVCVRVADLCAVEGTMQDLEQCVQDVEKLQKIVGEEPVERAAACVEGADTCAEAMGCIAGEGMNTMQEQLDEFFEGVRRGVDQKSR